LDKIPPELRKQAEKIVRERAEVSGSAVAPAPNSPEELNDMAHELQVQRAGLEIVMERLLRSQAELEASRAMFADLFDGAPVAYFTLLDGIVTQANKRGCDLLKRTREELLDQSLDRFVAPQDRQVYADHLRTASDLGTRQAIEIMMLPCGGRTFFARLETQAMRDGDEQEVSHRVALLDVTERKILEQELIEAREQLEKRVEERTSSLWEANEALRYHIEERERAEQELELKARELARSNEDLQEFAYVASHELQEPLRNVTNCMHMLRRRLGDDVSTDQAQLITYAEESAERLRALITDLLTYSRVNTRGREIQAVPANESLDQALANLRALIQDTDALITADPLPTVLADPFQLTQVFQNLIGNAMKFKDNARPEVHVGVIIATTEWIFRVTDNGIGMDPASADKAFSIFGRLHSKSAYEGTGIGLAIAKKIVERHRGRIWFESVPGRGSTFFFTIPGKDHGML
jgi:PAS domain S-box-containing protein